MSDLLFNGAGQPTLGSELRAELDSALGVDVVWVFVVWGGVRTLKDQVAGGIGGGGGVDPVNIWQCKT